MNHKELRELRQSLSLPVNTERYDYVFQAVRDNHWHLFFNSNVLTYKELEQEVVFMLGDLVNHDGCLVTIDSVQGNVRVDIKFSQTNLKYLSYRYFVSQVVQFLIGSQEKDTRLCL